jgi:polyferredoxin
VRGPDIFPAVSIRVKGTTGLLIAAALVIILLISFPAYRVFFGISVGIGIIVAAILYLRNKYFPIREDEVESKRPLGLD